MEKLKKCPIYIGLNYDLLVHNVKLPTKIEEKYLKSTDCQINACIPI